MSDKPIEIPPLDETAIAEQAARWHAVLKTATPQELAKFAAWLKLSPRHGHHFLCTTAIDELLNHIDPEGDRLDPYAWVKEARQNIIPLSPAEPYARPQARAPHGSNTASPQKSRRAFFVASIASGCAALCVAAGFIATRHGEWQEFSTRIGEQRAIELEDGSIVHLNTATHLRLHLTKATRDIRLLEGEALFKVHRDPTRPFRVLAPGSVIQAIGTEFNVYRRQDATRVAVLEGEVRILPDTLNSAAALSDGSAHNTSLLAPTDVAATSLSAGQEADINSSGHINRKPTVDVMNAVAWRQRRLVFRADALTDLVTEFNRYNRTPKFRLEGVDGHARHYTGTFDADDPDSFATVLTQERSYSIERTPREIIIRPDTADRETAVP